MKQSIRFSIKTSIPDITNSTLGGDVLEAKQQELFFSELRGIRDKVSQLSIFANGNNDSSNEKDGNTVVSKYCNLHYDVVSLTVKKHILFAKDVVLKIFALEEARSKNGTQDGQSSLIKRYSEETQFVMVDQWIQNGEINIDQLKDRQKEALLKWREKRNKAS